MRPCVSLEFQAEAGLRLAGLEAEAAVGSLEARNPVRAGWIGALQVEHVEDIERDLQGGALANAEGLAER